MRPSIPPLSVFSDRSVPQFGSTPPRKCRVHNAIALGLTCAALLCGATTQNAHAKWVLDHVETTGDAQYHSGTAPGIAPVNSTESLSEYISPGVAGIHPMPSGWSPVRVEAANKVEGQVRVIFRWESMGEEPPEYVTFKINAGGGAAARRDSTDTTLPHNATGEKAETTIMGITGTPYVNAYETSNRSSTVQYKTVAVDENGKVTSPWVDVKLSAEVGAERYTTVTMFGGMTAETPLTGHLFIGWTIDFSNPIEKYVLVTSDMEPNFYKGTASNGNSVPLTKAREKDGSISVDSVASSENGEDWLISQSFTANLNGPWSAVDNGTTLVWSGVSGNPLVSDRRIYQVFMTKTKNQLPFTATLNLSASDAVDGFNTQNSYAVTWHLPVENVRYDPDKPQDIPGKRYFPGLGRHVNLDDTYSETISPGQTTKFYEGARQVTVDYGPALKVVSVSAAVVGAAVGGATLVGIGAGTALAGPVGFGITVALAFVSGAAGAIDGTPPDPVLNDGPTASIGEWREALATQNDINNAPVGSPLANGATRFTGSQELLDDALEELTNLQDQYGVNWEGQWDQSYYFQLHGDKLTTQLNNGYYTRSHNTLEDIYDKNGFKGVDSQIVTVDTAIFHEFKWTYTGTQRPNPNV